MPQDKSQSEMPPVYVRCDIDRGLALVTLDRPERLNAMGDEMGSQFDRLMVELAQDESVRAVVLTGAGRAFCAGADMARLTGYAASGGETAKLRTAAEPRGAFRALAGRAPGELLTRYNSPQALPQPVIAAVNGPCVGIGVALAAMCDIRFAAPEAYFLTPYASRGLVAETGIAHTLSRLAGAGMAADMLLSGRRVGAEEALRVGLVTHVSPSSHVLEPAMAYARNIVETMSPRSTRVMKRQLWLSHGQSFLDGCELAMEETRTALGSEDFQEGVAHFREKRPPRFIGR